MMSYAKSTQVVNVWIERAYTVHTDLLNRLVRPKVFVAPFEGRFVFAIPPADLTIARPSRTNRSLRSPLNSSAPLKRAASLSVFL